VNATALIAKPSQFEIGAVDPVALSQLEIFEGEGSSDHDQDARMLP